MRLSVSDTHLKSLDNPALRRSENTPTYREYLLKHASFSDVVSITNDETREKIHENYRLMFLRDTALAASLDEQATANVTTQIFLKNLNLVNEITRNVDYLRELVRKCRSSIVEERKAAVLFLTEIMGTLKGIQGIL